MRLTIYLLSGAGLACLLVSCGADPASLAGPSPSDPTGSGTSSLAASVAGRGGGGGGKDHGAGLRLSGGIASVEQPAVIDRDTKFRLKILAGTDNNAPVYEDAFHLSGLAGFPAPGLAGCVVDPPDAPAATVQRLIERLDDPAQPRNRVVISIDKGSLGQPGDGGLTHNWADDVDGVRYRTWLVTSDHFPGSLVTVTEVSADIYDFSGGSIVNWDTSSDVKLICPNGGTLRVELTR